MSRRLRVLVLMPVWHPGFAYRYHGVIRELRSRGFEVTFGVVTPGEFRARQGRGVPVVPQALLDSPEFRDVEGQPVNTMPSLWRLLGRNDIVLAGTGKGFGRVFAAVAASGKPFLQWNDIGDFHMYRYPADRYIVAGSWFRAMALQDGDAAPEAFLVTGDPRFDGFPPPLDDIATAGFMARYGLDASRPVAVFCSGSLQRQDAWTSTTYGEILKHLEESGRYQPIIRIHPNEYAGHKAHHRKDHVDWKRNVPVVELEDLLAAMALCQLIVCVETGTCIESSMYAKNCLVVNLHEWCLNDVYRTSRDHFPTRRFRGMGLTRVAFDDRIRQLQRNGILRGGASIYRTESFAVPDYAWLGGDCHVDELPDVLASADLISVDERARRAHVAEYWHRDDHQAASRIAAVVESVQVEPDLAEKLRRSSSSLLGWPRRGRQLLWRARDAAGRMGGRHEPS